MPTTNVKTYTVLRTEIKQEAKVEGADNLDQMVFDLIQEILTSACENKRYLEMLILNVEIPTVSLTSLYVLPTDFMAIRSVKYREGTFPLRVLHDRNLYVENPVSSNPRYYEVVGNSISVTPSTNIPTGNGIVIDYYKYPNVIVAGDPFPIPKLIATVKQKVVARLHLYNKSLQVAQAFQAEGTANAAVGHTPHS